jgi:protein-S-isoprenylcysteine O-methyltransferase Ste14
MRGPAVSDRALVQRLARLRVTLGFVFGALVLWLAEPTGATLAAGTVIAALGEALRVWAAGHLNKAREVTASGPYRWLAHPLYVGSSIMGVGLAVVSASPLVFGLIAAYLAATLTAAIKSEEAFLRGHFGERYDQYRSGSRVESAQRFSLAQAMANHEYRALIGLGLAVLLLALKATYNGMFWRAGSHP